MKPQCRMPNPAQLHKCGPPRWFIRALVIPWSLGHLLIGHSPSFPGPSPRPAPGYNPAPMAKARAILKRRKAVKNIRKITKTMQMIATAKFQKSLKRAVSTKPYTLKVRKLVEELAASVGNVEHPLLRKVGREDRVGRIALVVITSN